MSDDAASPDPTVELIGRPPAGRVFTAPARVRLGDVGPKGRLRLDAAARHVQDVSNDDATEAMGDDAMAWVVRRMRIDVEAFPRFREDLTLTTWCSGVGGRWAARRIDVEGAEGGLLRCEALWVHLDVASGTPRKLPPSFEEQYGQACGDRRVRARLHHVTEPAPGAESLAWTTRFTDMDLLGHVNNALSWAMVEEALSSRPAVRAARPRITVEHPGPIDPGQRVELLVADVDDGFDLWALADGAPATTAQVRSAASGVSS